MFIFEVITNDWNVPVRFDYGNPSAMNYARVEQTVDVDGSRVAAVHWEWKHAVPSGADWDLPMRRGVKVVVRLVGRSHPTKIFNKSFKKNIPSKNH